MKIEVKYRTSQPVIMRVDYDSSPESPREWDNLGKMQLYHGRYDLEQAAGIDVDELDRSDSQAFYESLKDKLEKEHGAAVVLPVSMYEHGGVRVYVGDRFDRWDGGLLGAVYATREDILKEYGVKKITKAIRERVESVLTAEVETYSSYLNGDVYGYDLRTEAGEFIDSCGGFYGDTAAEDMKDSAGLEQYENIRYEGDAACLIE